MGNLIGIIGPSGSGKSSSARNLNPDETFYINVVGKSLPWKGSKTQYSVEKKNLLETNNAKIIQDYLMQINDKAPHIKYVIVDDSQYVMSIEAMTRAKETGYSKFTEIAQNMFKLFDKTISFRSDLTIIYMGHSEEVYDNGVLVNYKMKTIGQMIDNTINLEGLFTVCLYTRVTESDKDGTTYEFVTNKLGKYPAKSPLGMFDTITIPNDLKIVIDKMNEYYS